MFKFIIYATRVEMFAQEIAHIRSLLDAYDTELAIISDRAELVCLIPGLNRESAAAVLFASSDEDLEYLVKIKEHFGSIPTVLVLPDDRTETFQTGMLLNPLFFMSKNETLMHLSFTINELCYIYKDRFSEPSQFSFVQ